MSDNEAEYFFLHNQELLARLRERQALASATNAIRAESDTIDPELAEMLARLGVDAMTLPVLHLAPLLQVAWADGDVQPEERRLLRIAASDQALSDTAEAFFEKCLIERPSAAFFEGALQFLQLTLAAHSAAEADAEIASLGEMAFKIAEAAGGLFGIFGKVDADEKSALRDIAHHLETVQPEAARELLERL